jgi:hypothetical protein
MTKNVAAFSIDGVKFAAGIAPDGCVDIPSLRCSFHEITGFWTLKEKEVHRYLIVQSADRPPRLAHAGNPRCRAVNARHNGWFDFQ